MSKSQTPRLHIDWLDRDATEIVRVLQKNGYTAYLVGGCVRDLLLGKHPKDYDIATTALPREVKKCIRNSYIIGKRFRLVLAKRGNELYEIATFRKDPEKGSEEEQEIEGDNLFGTPQDDSTRRDFTVNALFYDPISEELIDYAEGMHDLEAGVVRVIGDPVTRFKEDPIRIMRGIRLAHMIRFQLDSELKKGIAEVASDLAESPLPRRREELLKFLRLDDPSLAFLTSEDLDVLKYITPTLHITLKEHSNSEIFYDELREFHNAGFETPLELFSGLMLSYLKHFLDFNIDSHDISKYKASEDERIIPIMRDELGMFKAEQLTFEKALKLIPTLRKVQELKNKNERRRWALFRMEAFPLALKIIEKEFLLNSEDLNFWKTEYANRPKEPERPHGRKTGGKKRRRRPRNRNRN